MTVPTAPRQRKMPEGTPDQVRPPGRRPPAPAPRWASCGPTRRTSTPFHFFHPRRDTTASRCPPRWPPARSCVLPSIISSRAYRLLAGCRIQLWSRRPRPCPHPGRFTSPAQNRQNNRVASLRKATKRLKRDNYPSRWTDQVTLYSEFEPQPTGELVPGWRVVTL
jgi:hypothetical protein